MLSNNYSMLNGKPVLVIEDDEASAFYLEEILSEINFSVITATNSAQAIDLVGKNEFCLILMDIRLPDIDGYELTRKFRNNGMTVPIIAQTAFVLPHDREKAINCGCDDYIAKPIRKEILFDIISNYLKIDIPRKNKG